MQKIIHEIFLDHITFVTQANDKIIKPIMAVYFHDMPEDGFAANFHHGLGAHISFFRYTGT